MRRQSVGGYPGVCQVHRAELKMLRGQWSEAEQEARQACEELERYRLMDGVGFAHYQVGEVRLRMGDLDAAAEAFDRAYEYGHDAQPGLALLQLARGEVGDAQRSIERALAAASGTGGVRRPGDARPAAAGPGRDRPRRRRPRRRRPGRRGARIDRSRLRTAALPGGRADRPRRAAARGRTSHRRRRRSSASRGDCGRRPTCRTRAPGRACATPRRWRPRATQATARRDLLAARAAFERLGATLDLERVDALLGEERRPARRRRPLRRQRATKTFMFTDIVTSTDLVGLIGDEAWNELLRWHDRELRSAFAQHGGEVVNHTGDGFFVAFERAADAIDCAVDIQRRLVRHRREHGFAPWVRIGLHRPRRPAGVATYSGQGVHVAARVGAAAGQEEILATSAVLADAGRDRGSACPSRAR